MSQEVHRSACISLGDIDSDGDLDAIIGNGKHWAEHSFVLFNTKGDFTVSRVLDHDMTTTYGCALVDLDRDGDLDFIQGNENAPNRMFKNDGQGRFSFYSNVGAIGNVRAIEVADLNGDSYLDLVLAKRGQPIELCLGDPVGRFARCRSLTRNGDTAVAVKAADIDRDNDLDLIGVSLEGHPARAYINDGRGAFDTPVAIGNARQPARAVALGDLDKDGNVDVVVGYLGAKTMVFWGSRSGNWRGEATLGTVKDETYSIQIQDMDLDGRSDIVVGNEVGGNAVYFGLPLRRNFQRTAFGTPAHKTFALVLTDMNMDKYPDIIALVTDKPNMFFYSKEAE